MAAQVFYRKWRPQRFADVVGQEYARQTLLNALSTGRIAHAYLFCGPRGTGKTSTGRILAKALNCLQGGKGEPCNRCATCVAATEGRAMDLIEIDGASNRSIDDVRNLRDKVNFAPNQARYKVYIIDEVHMLTPDAFNALLKTLEEPPPHTIFILATTEAHKLPATVISRCQRFDFRRISLSDVVDRLAKLCQDEGIKAAPEVLHAVARSAGGSLRDAENILEQLVVGYGADLNYHQLKEFLGLGGEQQVKALVTAAVTGDVAGGLAAISQAADEGLDLRQLHRQIMEYARGLLLVKAGAGESADVPPEQRMELQKIANGPTLERVLRAVKLFGQADLRANNYSTLPLELALVEACSQPAEAPRAEAAPRAPARAPAPPPGPRAAQPAPARPSMPAHGAPASPRPPQPVAGRPSPVARPSSGPPLSEEPPSVPAAVAPAAATPPPSASTQPGPAVTPPPAAAPNGAAPISPVAQSPAAAVSPQGADGDHGDPLGKLRANWRAVAGAVRGQGQKYKLDALLRDGEPVSVDDEEVVVAFRAQGFVDMMKTEMDNPSSRKALEEALAGVLGSRHRVRCVVKSKDKKPGGHLARAAMEMGARPVQDGGQ